MNGARKLRNAALVMWLVGAVTGVAGFVLAADGGGGAGTVAGLLMFAGTFLVLMGAVLAVVMTFVRSSRR